jgi:hypothetical protein
MAWLPTASTTVEPVRSDMKRWAGGGIIRSSVVSRYQHLEHAIAPFGQAEPGTVNGPAAMRQTAQWLLAQFPDLHMLAEALKVRRTAAAGAYDPGLPGASLFQATVSEALDQA